jgi:hypothetical protein
MVFGAMRALKMKMDSSLRWNDSLIGVDSSLRWNDIAGMRRDRSQTCLGKYE